MAGVAADILTGFLGSGKTTLLKHVLEHGLDGRRVAVIMNEIGDIGIDGQVISGLQAVEEMVELSSGCICCSIGTQFTLAIREILQKAKPHLIVVEATGVAEPGPLANQVREAGPALDAVIAVVDAENALETLGQSPTAVRQVEEADFLVLNKIDLVDQARLRKVEKELGLLNPRALLRRTEFGRVDTDLLFGTSAGRFREQLGAGAAGEAAPGRNHVDAEEFEAFHYRGEPGDELHRGRFERFLYRLPRDVYRAKGIVQLAGEGSPCLFNFTCGRFEIDWFLPPGTVQVRNQAVFIGRRVRRHEARVLAALQRCRPGYSRFERLRVRLGSRSSGARDGA